MVRFLMALLGAAMRYRYEYDVVHFRGLIPDVRTGLQTWLNERAADGWELVATSQSTVGDIAGEPSVALIAVMRKARVHTT